MAFKVKLPIIHLGAAYRKTFRWYSEDALGARTPVDLTGLEGHIQLRTGPRVEPVLADWSTSNGRLILSEVNLITICLGTTETESYSFEEASWDLIVWPTLQLEERELIMYGTVSTRRTLTGIP